MYRNHCYIHVQYCDLIGLGLSLNLHILILLVLESEQKFSDSSKSI